MHDGTSQQPCPLPTQVNRARRAELRLRSVLQRLNELQERGDNCERQHHDLAADAPESMRSLPQMSSPPSEYHNLVSPATTAEVSSSPCPLVFEWTMPSLTQRVQQKMARDALRKQRRDARKAATAASTTATASATAAEMVRNALSQPLGAVAVRFLSAAASGAPLRFPDVTTADGLARNGPAPSPSLPPQVSRSAHAQPVANTTPAPYSCMTQQQTDRDKHPASPTPASNIATMSILTSPQRIGRQPSRSSCSHHDHHQGRDTMASASPTSRNSADRKSIPRALPLPTSPPTGSTASPLSPYHVSPRHPSEDDRCRYRREYRHHHHHRQRRGASGNMEDPLAPTQNSLVASVSKHKPLPAPLGHQDGSPKTNRSQSAGVIGEGSISLLARTLREVSTAAFSTPSQARNEEGRLPAAHHCHRARHYNCSHLSGEPQREKRTSNVGGKVPSAADQRLLNSPCMSSTSSYGNWSESEGSWSSRRSPTSLAHMVRSPPSELFTPLTIPRNDRYDPHAPLLPLMSCYGDTPTREVLSHVPSTSTQCTADRSSTSVSSEWTLESSSTGAAFAVAASASAADLCVRDAQEKPLKTADPGNASSKTVGGPRQSDVHDHHQAIPRSPISNTQLSYGAEMDAIARGVVAPYVSYLFSPEARVTDLCHMKSRVGCSGPTSRLGATCVGFSRTSDVYLVGTTSGVLWKVPVGGDSEVVLATPLGSLWPPHAPASPKPTVSGITVGVGDPAGTASDAPGGGDSTLPPVPLHGHTAAILSITFNDDDSLFATTGMDGCVIVWNASTSAKLRRINSVWASSSSQSSSWLPVPTNGGVDTTASQRAPHLVCFMPQNNNYLLVSYVGSSELHLYNSSTGLPVTNVAGAGTARAPARKTSLRCRDAARKHVTNSHIAGDSPVPAAPSRAITALAVNPVSSPFFLSGDASGTVALWTYRAGDLAIVPTLRATTLVGNSSGQHARPRPSVVDPPRQGTLGSAGNGLEGTRLFPQPPHQFPELRRVTALALPKEMGGIAAVGVSALHTSQLQSLFHCRGPRQDPTSAETTSNGSAASAQRNPRHPLEPTAQIFRATAQQNRACRAAAEAHGASDKTAAASVACNRRDAAGQGSAPRHPARLGGPTTLINTGARGDGSKNPSHALSDFPARLSETFSALWRSVGRSQSAEPHLDSEPSRVEEKVATSKLKKPTTSSCSSLNAGTDAPGTALSEGELLRQLRDDALDVVCPFLVLVTLPCDTVYALGVLLQLQPGVRPGSVENTAGRRASTVCYMLYPLLKMTSQSRLRHLGVGAVQSPDNPRLIVVATPCEEGFVRVEPLLRLESPPLSMQHAHQVDASPDSDPSVGFQQMGKLAVEHGEGWRRSPSHVLATLPMPYGGRCTGVAWSPNGRFLVAITAEGVIYQWARVYLLNSSPSRASNASAVAAAGARVTASKEDMTRAGGERVTAKQPTTPSKGGGDTKISPTAGATAAAAARRRGCTTDQSDAMSGVASLTANFTTLLGIPMAIAAGPPSSLPFSENAAARAAFSEEDAWRKSLHRELERQRRAQAALKLVAHAAADEEDALCSSDYFLNDDDAPNSAVTRDSFEG